MRHGAHAACCQQQAHLLQKSDNVCCITRACISCTLFLLHSKASEVPEQKIQGGQIITIMTP